MFLSDLLNIIGTDLYVRDEKIKCIKTDSRKIKKGDAFLCINNGYKYIDDAIKRGAKVIITEQDITKDGSVLIIKVESTVKVLGKIATYLRDNYHGKVIAITGSNGKSTTKEVLSHLLSKKNKVLKNVGNENNDIGVPNTMLKLDDSYDYLILELGTNHPGEIKYLTNIVKPNIVIITNIGNAHIGNFKSQKNILKEKLDICYPNAEVFLNGDDELLKKQEGIKVYQSDYSSLKMPNSIDYALAFKVCESMGYKKRELMAALKDFKNLPSRMNFINIKGVTIIDDAYNASYESVVKGLDSIVCYQRKIIILGDMLELGKYSKKLHKKIYHLIKKLDNYILITVGSKTAVLKNKKHFNNVTELYPYLEEFSFMKGDVIYLKGSHEIGLYQLVEPLVKRLENR